MKRGKESSYTWEIVLNHSNTFIETFSKVEHCVHSEKLNFFQKCRNAISRRKDLPATIIGRIAGQYAKPRTNEFIIVKGKKIHNYKGDNVNSVE